ncbi:hypothetical protein AERO9AM_30314 [Aeromicrobium sp. 9AM]|nr:hypothetical protein AERO9AM_30314 [Aeromicrobium sp. 9AM]
MSHSRDDDLTWPATEHRVWRQRRPAGYQGEADHPARITTCSGVPMLGRSLSADLSVLPVNRLSGHAEQSSDLCPAEPGVAGLANCNLLATTQFAFGFSNRSKFADRAAVVTVQRSLHACQHVLTGMAMSRRFTGTRLPARRRQICVPMSQRTLRFRLQL